FILVMVYQHYYNTKPSKTFSLGKKSHNQRPIAAPLPPARTDVSVVEQKKSEQTEQVSPRVVALAAVLEPGDIFRYKTVKLMKLERKVITEDETQFIKDRWAKEVENFLVYELKMNDVELQQYLEAKREAFQLYDSLIEAIERETKEKFGDQFQII